MRSRCISSFCDWTMRSKEEKKKSESESITFRIPAKLLNELRQESEKKQSELKHVDKSDIYRPHSMAYLCETNWTILCPEAINIKNC
jgi:hypothetical protein